MRKRRSSIGGLIVFLTGMGTLVAAVSVAVNQYRSSKSGTPTRSIRQSDVPSPIAARLPQPLDGNPSGQSESRPADSDPENRAAGDESKASNELTDEADDPGWERFQIRTVAINDGNGAGLRGVLVDEHGEQVPEYIQQAYFAARRRMTGENTKRLQRNRMMRNAEAQAASIVAELTLRETMARLRAEEQANRLAGSNPSSYVVPFANGLENGYVRIDGPLSTVVHSNGTIQQHYRDGDWVYYRDNVGGIGAQFNDRARQVQRYDFQNPVRGTRTIGENPYGSVPGTQRWTLRTGPNR